MANILSLTSVIPLYSSRYQCVNYRPNSARKFCRFRCTGETSSGSSSKDEESKQENALLKLAWYGSELLGIGASFFRPPPTAEGHGNGTATSIELPRGVSGAVDRALIVETIKKDFERSYFVTGNLTPDAYEEECEFADPAGSFKGLERFKRNCTNFGSLIEKSTMKLTKWEDMEDRGIGHWKFSCIMSFPWRPILSGRDWANTLRLGVITVFLAATGFTEYYFDSLSGKVCRHVESWNVPKMALLKQIFRPTRDWLWFKTRS